MKWRKLKYLPHISHINRSLMVFPNYSNITDRAIGISKGLPVSSQYVQKVIDEYPKLTDKEICDLIIAKYETGNL